MEAPLLSKRNTVFEDYAATQIELFDLYENCQEDGCNQNFADSYKYIQKTSEEQLESLSPELCLTTPTFCNSKSSFY